MPMHLSQEKEKENEKKKNQNHHSLVDLQTSPRDILKASPLGSKESYYILELEGKEISL